MWEEQLETALKAGLSVVEPVLKIYNSAFEVEIKSDNSPVTIADKMADKLIREYLHNAYPTYSFLTEESEDDKSRLNNDYVWIVDPIDGTKDFVARDNEFTVNIALAYKHELVVGVVIAPALGDIYFASKGNGAYYQKGDKVVKIHVNDKVEKLTVLTSAFHFNEKEADLIKKHSDKIMTSIKVGSSLKACRIAQGLAEISYRMADGTKEWDTAACQCVVEEAGGLFVKHDGSSIRYNREDVYNHDGYIIVNRKENMLL